MAITEFKLDRQSRGIPLVDGGPSLLHVLGPHSFMAQTRIEMRIVVL
jgi:hypothetical protein